MYLSFSKNSTNYNTVSRVNKELNKFRMNSDYIEECAKWNLNKDEYIKTYKKAMMNYFKTK